jgi:hypothetical protein
MEAKETPSIITTSRNNIKTDDIGVPFNGIRLMSCFVKLLKWCKHAGRHTNN